MAERIGLQVRTKSAPRVLHRLTGVIADHGGDILSVEISGAGTAEARVYFEIDLPTPSDTLVADLRALDGVRDVEVVNTLQTIYGKRIIIIGGGAQVGQAAIGAISEAARHNIRGERISVDPLPLVGELPPAAAVRAVARPPRAKALVLAVALMGGATAEAVPEA